MEYKFIPWMLLTLFTVLTLWVCGRVLYSRRKGSYSLTKPTLFLLQWVGLNACILSVFFMLCDSVLEVQEINASTTLLAQSIPGGQEVLGQKSEVYNNQLVADSSVRCLEFEYWPLVLWSLTLIGLAAGGAAFARLLLEGYPSSKNQLFSLGRLRIVEFAATIFLGIIELLSITKKWEGLHSVSVIATLVFFSGLSILYTVRIESMSTQLQSLNIFRTTVISLLSLSQVLALASLDLNYRLLASLLAASTLFITVFASRLVSRLYRSNWEFDSFSDIYLLMRQIELLKAEIKREDISPASRFREIHLTIKKMMDTHVGLCKDLRCYCNDKRGYKVSQLYPYICDQVRLQDPTLAELIFLIESKARELFKLQLYKKTDVSSIVDAFLLWAEFCMDHTANYPLIVSCLFEIKEYMRLSRKDSKSVFNFAYMRLLAMELKLEARMHYASEHNDPQILVEFDYLNQAKADRKRDGFDRKMVKFNMNISFMEDVRQAIDLKIEAWTMVGQQGKLGQFMDRSLQFKRLCDRIGQRYKGWMKEGENFSSELSISYQFFLIRVKEDYMGFNKERNRYRKSADRLSSFHMSRDLEDSNSVFLSVGGEGKDFPKIKSASASCRQLGYGADLKGNSLNILMPNYAMPIHTKLMTPKYLTPALYFRSDTWPVYLKLKDKTIIAVNKRVRLNWNLSSGMEYLCELAPLESRGLITLLLDKECKVLDISREAPSCIEHGKTLAKCLKEVSERLSTMKGESEECLKMEDVSFKRNENYKAVKIKEVDIRRKQAFNGTGLEEWIFMVSFSLGQEEDEDNLMRRTTERMSLSESPKRANIYEMNPEDQKLNNPGTKSMAGTEGEGDEGQERRRLSFLVHSRFKGGPSTRMDWSLLVLALLLLVAAFVYIQVEASHISAIVYKLPYQFPILDDGSFAIWGLYVFNNYLNHRRLVIEGVFPDTMYEKWGVPSIMAQLDALSPLNLPTNPMEKYKVLTIRSQNITETEENQISSALRENIVLEYLNVTTSTWSKHAPMTAYSAFQHVQSLAVELIARNYSLQPPVGTDPAKDPTEETFRRNSMNQLLAHVLKGTSLLT